MSLRSRYVIGLYRDVNPTKNRCRPNIVCPLGMMMKPYQLFRFYKPFRKEREKTLIQQSMRIEKLGKVGLCFIKVCFIKLFKIITIFSLVGLFVHKNFLFASSFAAQFSRFDIRLTQGFSKREIGNSKLLRIAS